MKHLKTYESFNSGRILYHGSPNRFDTFTLDFWKETSEFADHGYGIYLSDKKDAVKSYATRRDKTSGFIYTVEIDSDLNLVEWQGKVTQDVIEKAAKLAIEMGIITHEKLDMINAVDKNIKDENDTVLGFSEFYNKYGKELSIHRTFEDIDPNAKYPNIYEEFYNELSKDIFGRNDKKASEFLSKIGIDGMSYTEERTYYSIYVIYDVSKLKIKNVEPVE